MISRKKFLRISYLGALGILSPIDLFSNSEFSFDEISPDNEEKAKQLAFKAKKLFCQKSYSNAEELYKEAIELVPSQISYYDNLRKVLACQNKNLEIYKLFKRGIELNNLNSDFYDRLAVFFVKTELGNRKLKIDLRKFESSNSLLLNSKEIWEKALVLDQNKKYIEKRLERVNFLINNKYAEKDFRFDKVKKSKKNKDAIKFKKRYNNFDSETLIKKLKSIDKKKRNTFLKGKELEIQQKNIIKEKKRIYKILSERSLKEKEIFQASIYLENILDLDYNDFNTIQKLTSLYKKRNDFEKLLRLKRKLVEVNDNVWSYLGYMDAINYVYQKKPTNIKLDESIRIGKDLLQNWDLIPSLKIDVLNKYIETVILQGKFMDAQNIYENNFDILTKVSEGQLNKFIYGYSKLFYVQNKYNEAENILLGVLENKKELIINSTLKSALEAKGKDINKKHVKLKILLSKIYNKQNKINEELAVLQDISKIDSNNSYVIKNMKLRN